MKDKFISFINLIRVIITIWAFATTAIFATNGIAFLTDERYALAVGVFGVSFLYCLVLIISLVIAVKHRKTKNETKQLRNINFAKKFLKLIILVSTVIFATNIFSPAVLIRRINIAWAIITILFDIAFFTITLIGKRFAESIKEVKK